MLLIKIILGLFLVALLVMFIARAVVHAQNLKESIDEIKENRKKKKEE